MECVYGTVGPEYLNKVRWLLVLKELRIGLCVSVLRVPTLLIIGNQDFFWQCPGHTKPKMVSVN
jgi:hypothetical protein